MIKTCTRYHQAIWKRNVKILLINLLYFYDGLISVIQEKGYLLVVNNGLK